MRILNCASLLCLVISAGCAHHRSNVTLAPVGPVPRDVVQHEEHPEGWLRVYSARDAGAPGDMSDVIVNHHSDYRVLSLDGKPVKHVNNFVGTYIEDPVTASLLPGRYVIKAQVATMGNVTIPIAIETGKTTVVHLDGSRLSSSERAPGNDFVRLSNGWIVGWHAKENSETK